MKPFADYGETITSGKMVTGSATIELTPEMFTLLSDGMYSDKILAPIRESICNARDAHIDAEVTKNLEIHLPTRLEPFFHVRDFGKALSERQILGYDEQIQAFDEKTGEAYTKTVHVAGLYLRYGKSTKRDSNLQIGGFGIGCKSPLAYSDSFIVESIQDGMIKTYTIYKENGIPNVAKLNEKVTNEPTGLKVKLAVASHDTDTFVTKAATFLRHFDYPCTMTGQRITYEVKTILSTPLYDTVEVGYGQQGQIKAIMGGVVYAVSDKYKQELEQVVQNNMLIMKFEIGDLSVAGSRENLSEDEDTVAKLDITVGQIKKDFYAVMQAEVEDPKHSIFEAIEVLRKFDMIRNNWRTGKHEAVKGSKNFKIDGVLVEDVLDKMAAIKVRAVSASASYDSDSKHNLSSFRQVPIVLDIDRGSGYLKVARKLSRDDNRATVVLAQDELELEQLTNFFGKDNLTIEKVTVKYAEFFPKGAPTVGKVKVAKSGLFNSRGNEITEIEEGQVGFYIPFERFSCIMKGSLGKGVSDITQINPLMKAIIVAGQLKEDELFYSRKSGMRAIAKTNLVELTWADVVKLTTKCYTRTDYAEHVRQASTRTNNPATSIHKGLAPLWDEVKQNYPTWSNTAQFKATKGREFLSNCALVGVLETNWEKDRQHQSDLYMEEEKLFNADFPLLKAFGSAWWNFSNEQVQDVVDFCIWKRDTTLLNKKAA